MPPAPAARCAVRSKPRLTTTLPLAGILAATLAFAAPDDPAEAQTCARTIVADVVALDQVFFWNRLGAVQPQGMIYALRRDVVSTSGGSELVEGQVMLRPDKRPRPLVLRMGVGDCLVVEFQNLLAPSPVDQQQPATREASFHPVGLELVETILHDGTHVGQNAPGWVAPGGTARYVFYATREGQHLVHSGGAMVGGEGDGGSTNAGLFGSVNVEPANAVPYRSQTTREDIRLAARKATATGPTIEDAEMNFTSSGAPRIDYDAKYPSWHPKAGDYILRMYTDTNEILYSDLTAIITGSDPDGGWGAGGFPQGTYPEVTVVPNRNQAFREFTIIYHGEIGAVQAFPIFEDETFSHTLHSGRDAFAINYGTGGIGAEILANRLGVGPMHACTTCKYEEFFLSAWTVGDPAQIVDFPANGPCDEDDVRAEASTSNGDAVTCTPTPGPKATKVLYPDDPSNVYHSYLRDHVKFRTLHAGSKEHHIHHLHAHQWLYSPDGDNSSYLDSQALGPGASFTMEIAYDGSGNRNLTVGDSIFHCHFYPHFAQGMWAMWRVHDVLEVGTELDEDGKPVTGARALPDGEIAAGTPIPGVVPVPGIPMAPPTNTPMTIVNGQITFPNGLIDNPGYPFFIPGIAGERAPHPPLDFAPYDPTDPSSPPQDGGLPRHLINPGGQIFEVHTRLDFTKELEVVDAFELEETGEPEELMAMSFHGVPEHGTCLPNGLCDATVGGTEDIKFLTNGLEPRPGAPYADPCTLEPGIAANESFRRFKAADIELDVVLNKDGWHFPQQRMIALWEDVTDTLDGTRPPEPLFFRAHSDDCIEYWLTNLVPNIYELDDFQVRTPTDILGQHIHLVKFDVTSSDGSANGFNYEDGTFSPDEVRERIEAINAGGGILDLNGTRSLLEAEINPNFGAGPDRNNDGHPDWVGAQTTVQRWMADNVLNQVGHDRTLRTVFTHDHFGPSTHQQAGLYAGLVVEPEGSTWHHPITGTQYGTRHDGGPTSWKADIHTGDVDQDGEDDSYREFLLEFQDYQLAYYEGGGGTLTPWEHRARQPGEGLDDPPNAINPAGVVEDGLPFLLKRPAECPGGKPLPCPEVISADDVGTMSVNYRNEPLALRVRDPATNQQATGDAGDLALAFSSLVDRADNDFDVQPRLYTERINEHSLWRDPYTPLMEAFRHDPVQVRILVGAHEEGHNFAINGMKWPFEPSEKDSGWRASQMMGISEHFEFVVPQVVHEPLKDKTDYLWTAGASTDDLWNGIWGLLRVYKREYPNLQRLPSNPLGGHDITEFQKRRFDGVCLKNAPVRSYTVVAGLARDLLPRETLIYNSRDGAQGDGPLHDPTAIVYLLDDHIDPNTGRLWSGWQMFPLVLRANAGDCIEVTLENRLPEPASEPILPDLDGYSTLPMIVDQFNFNQIHPSHRVGLHPQLVHYDASRDDGNDVGTNNITTVLPGASYTYQWYAGDVYVRADGTVRVTPIEFGATNLMPADRMKQPSKGAIGGLIIEPEGSTWAEDAIGPFQTPQPIDWTSATVTPPTGDPFREFVLFTQNDVNMRFGLGFDTGNLVPPDGGPVQNLAGTEDPEDSGQKAYNYKTEPVWFRRGYVPYTPLDTTRTFQLASVFSNAEIGGLDPETPVFVAQPGADVRFRLLHPGGTQRNNVFHLHGHVWEQTPYTSADTTPIDPDQEIGATSIGDNPYSYYEGARTGIGPSCHDDVVLLHGAGGSFSVPGDYMFRDFQTFNTDGGLWGILRVGPYQQSGSGVSVESESGPAGR